MAQSVPSLQPYGAEQARLTMVNDRTHLRQAIVILNMHADTFHRGVIDGGCDDCVRLSLSTGVDLRRSVQSLNQDSGPEWDVYVAGLRERAMNGELLPMFERMVLRDNPAPKR